jgi:hypothetical protein
MVASLQRGCCINDVHVKESSAEVIDALVKKMTSSQYQNMKMKIQPPTGMTREIIYIIVQR